MRARSRARARSWRKRRGAPTGGAQRFVCVDCMESMLDTNVSDAMFNAVLVVGLVVVAVRWYGRFSFLPVATIVLLAAAPVALFLWIRARSAQRNPKKSRTVACKLFARRVDKLLAKRPGAHRR